MKREIKLFVALNILLLSFSVDALAQNGGFAGAAFQSGFGPRGMAMSNAMGASTSEGVYPYYNPALAAVFQEHNQIDLSVSSMDFDRVYQNAGVHVQLPPNAGIAFGLIRAGVKDIDARSLSGYPNGTFDISEYQLNTAFGIRFSPKFYGGVGIKLNYANYHEELSPATAVGLDLGFLYLLNESFNIGLSIQDLFANYTWNSGDLYGQSQSRNVVNNFPTRIKWAVSYQNKQFSINSEYELQVYSSEFTDNEIFIGDSDTPVSISTIETLNTNSGQFKIGGLWHAHERFTLRAGYRIADTKTEGSNALSAGFSVHLPFDRFSPSIDYAFVREPFGVSNFHVFALRLHL
ncbi:MAG: hypothetical protein NXI08_05330 [bacterium]|nr:hypothetical protein [bacterium]